MSKLSIIIPVYNEEATVTQILDKIRDTTLDVEKEIIIVNDGSSDSSVKNIEGWIAQNAKINCQLLNKENGGKGSAVREGIKKSTGDVVIIQDADLEYDPADYAKCIEPILSGRERVVYGSRARFDKNRLHSALSFYFGGLAVTYWMNFLFGSSMTDEPTCYKTFAGDLIRNLPFKYDGFAWEPEVTAKILRSGIEISEVPISYYPRKINEGKKIKASDGIYALLTALYWRFAPIGAVKKSLQNSPKEAEVLRSQQTLRKKLFFLCLFAFSIRIIFCIPSFLETGEAFLRPDSGSYIAPAKNLLATGSIGSATLRPPGFIILLSAMFAVVGECFRFIGGALVVFSALTCLPIFKAALLLKDERTAVIATLFYIFNLTSIANAPMILSDTFYLFFCAWQFYFFIKFYKKERLIDAWLCIFIAAICTLIRPVGILWIVPFLALILLFPKKRFSKKLICTIVAIFIFLGLLTPWMYRNSQLGAGFRFTTNTGNSLYHFCSSLVSIKTGIPGKDIRKQWYDEDKLTFADKAKFPDENSRQNHQISRAKKIIEKDLWAYLRLHFRLPILIPDAPKLCELLGQTKPGGGTLDILNRKGFFAATTHYFQGQYWLLILLSPAFFIVAIMYLSCFCSLIKWFRKRQFYLILIFLAFIVYYLILPGPVPMPRYHMPALPLLAIMAALFVSSILDKKKPNSF